MRIFQIFLIIGFNIFLGCSPNDVNHSNSDLLTLSLSNSESLKIKDIEILQLIPLETNAQNLMGNDLRVRFSKSKIYVMDIAQRDGIHIFSETGKFLKTVAIKGEGPNELEGLQDFQVDGEGQLYVLSTIGDLTTIYQVNEQDELQKLTDVAYLASAFSLSKNQEFYLYGSYNKPFVTHRLVRIDSNGKVLTSYLPNTYTNDMLPMTERNFFESNEDNLLLAEIFNDTLYSIQNEGLEPILKIDLGPYQIPKEFWEMDLMQGYEMIQKQGFAVFKSAFANSSRIISNVHYQGNEFGTKKKIYLIDKASGKTQLLDYPEREAEIWNDPIGLEGDQMLFLTYHSFLMENRSVEIAPDLMAKISEQEFDYPILIRTRLQ